MKLCKPNEGGSYSPVPAGTYMARCYRFVDLGTHTADYQGDRKTRREVMLSWEIPDELTDEGKPRTISKTYTWSTHEKATFRKHLETWRGKPFTETDFEGENAFDTRRLIGVPCMINIGNTEKGGKVYDSVEAVGKLMKGATVPAAINPPVYLSLTEEGWDPTVFAMLSDKLKQKIASSPEYRDLMDSARHSDDPGPERRDFDDDIGF